MTTQRGFTAATSPIPHEAEPTKQLRVLDLFSGIGGFSLGLERTGGFKTVAFCEIDPFCRRVLAKRWSDVPQHDDVETREFQEGEADVITGGFPCQDISFAGRGAGLAGERSGLYRHLIRAIRLVRPRYAIMENVAALLSRGLGTVLGDLAEIGHDAEWHCIPASAVGAPHRRDRIWIVAHARGEQHEGGGAPLRGPLAAELSEAVADADLPRLEGRISQGLRECSGGQGSPPVPYTTYFAALGEGIGRRESSGIWRTEPNVGRVAHGVPSELDRGRHAEEEHAAEASAEEHIGDSGVPILRGDGGIGAPSSRLFTSGYRGGLVSSLSRDGGPSGWNAEGQGDAGMCSLRQGIPADAQQETHVVQSRMSFGRWPHERGETLGQIWSEEPDIGRVAHGVPHRVDRLRSLGNAVVPQIPELIGNAILASLASRSEAA